MKLSCFRIPRGSGYAGERFARFSWLTEIRISHFCVLRPSLTGKKIARPPDSPDPPPKAFFIKKAKPFGFVLLICQAAFFLFEDRPHDGVQLT